MSAPTFDSPVGSTHSSALSYSSSGNVNILVVWVWLQGGGTVTGVSGSIHGAFTKRTSFTHVPGQSLELSEWWVAVAGGGGASVTGETITSTISGTENGRATIVTGVAGCSSTAPFDTNASFPANATGASSAPSKGSLNSDSAAPLVIGLVGTSSNITLGNNPGTSFSFDLHEHSSNGPPDNDLALEHYGASVALSSFTATWGTSLSEWAFLVDAFAPSGLSGTMAVTDTPDTFSASGYPGSPSPHGEWVSTEAPDIFAGVGHVSIFAAMAAYDLPDSFSGYLRVTDLAIWTTTEAKDIFAAVGHTVGVGGHWTSTEPVDIFAAIGHTPFVARLVVTEPPDRFSAIGVGATVFTKRRVFFVC